MATNELKDSGERRDFATGAVRDKVTGKGRFDLIPPIPMLLLARIYEMGAMKYADRNWEKGIPISVFVDSAKRHLDKYLAGMRDEPHLSMALWNIVGALHTAAMVQFGFLPEKLYEGVPNHLNPGAHPLSPSEDASIKTFGGMQTLTVPFGEPPEVKA